MSENNGITESEQRLYTFLSAMLFATGVIFYITWGIVYGAWNVFDRSNLGVYAVTLVLCGFGALGFILNSKLFLKE